MHLTMAIKEFVNSFNCLSSYSNHSNDVRVFNFSRRIFHICGQYDLIILSLKEHVFPVRSRETVGLLPDVLFIML